MSGIMKISDESFGSAVLGCKLPVLVEFGAEWSASCNQAYSVLEELAPEYEGRFVFAWMDADQNVQAFQRYSIKQMPVLLLFKNGQVKYTVSGVWSKKQLKVLLDQNLL